MKKQIFIQGRNIEYTLKLSRRSFGLRLTIHADGEIVVSASRFVTQRMIDSFLINKSDWILSKVDRFKSMNLTLLPKTTKADYLNNKEKALVFAEKKVAEFNFIYGFSFNKINIRDQKRRWGSCSKKGNLSFSYKLVLIPEKLADYIIVHEICHLGEFNHSKRFWDLVARTVPDHKERRKELRKLSFSLR